MKATEGFFFSFALGCTEAILTWINKVSMEAMGHILSVINARGMWEGRQKKPVNQ